MLYRLFQRMRGEEAWIAGTFWAGILGIGAGFE